MFRSVQGLDGALRGGIQFGGVTELVGPAGVGKSQCCFMLTLFAAVPRSLGGLEGAAMYIDTEGKFSSQRLVQMARCRYPEAYGAKEPLHAVLDRIMVVSPRTPEDLLRCLQVGGNRRACHPNPSMRGHRPAAAAAALSPGGIRGGAA